MFIAGNDLKSSSAGVVWRPVPKSLRPATNKPVSLFLIREEWRIEIVPLNRMGKFDLQNSTIKNPRLWAHIG